KSKERSRKINAYQLNEEGRADKKRPIRRLSKVMYFAVAGMRRYAGGRRNGGVVRGSTGMLSVWQDRYFWQGDCTPYSS
ncbi:hypothetical protein TNCV_2424281, partial [Trichonephila clavipes]